MSWHEASALRRPRRRSRRSWPGSRMQSTWSGSRVRSSRGEHPLQPPPGFTGKAFVVSTVEELAGTLRRSAGGRHRRDRHRDRPGPRPPALVVLVVRRRGWEHPLRADEAQAPPAAGRLRDGLLPDHGLGRGRRRGGTPVRLGHRVGRVLRRRVQASRAGGRSHSDRVQPPARRRQRGGASRRCRCRSRRLREGTRPAGPEAAAAPATGSASCIRSATSAHSARIAGVARSRYTGWARSLLHRQVTPYFSWRDPAPTVMVAVDVLRRRVVAMGRGRPVPAKSVAGMTAGPQAGEPETARRLAASIR